MLEITIKITQEPGDSYTPIETAVIEALQGAATIGTRTTTEATVKPAEASAAAAEAVAAEAPATPTKKAPARAPKAAAAPKPSTTQAAVLEEDPTDDKMDADAREAHDAQVEADTEDDEDLLGGGEERVYTVQEAVTRASAVVKEKDGRARIKVALARASEAGAATYGKVGDMAEDTAALGAFMTALEA